MTPIQLDFAVQNHGSICLLHPLTERALEWLETFVITEETQIWGQNAVVVEPRYLGDILDGIAGDGLSVHAGIVDTIN